MVSDKELLDLIDGNLSEEKAKELRNIIDQDTELQRRFETLTVVDETISGIPESRPSVSFTDNVMSNLNKKLATAGLDYNGFWKKNLFVVLTLVIIGFVAGVVLLSNFSLSEIIPAIEPREVQISDRTFSIDPGSLNFIKQDLFFKGFIYLNAILALFLLDRAVLKPYFRSRRQSYTF